MESGGEFKPKDGEIKETVASANQWDQARNVARQSLSADWFSEALKLAISRLIYKELHKEFNITLNHKVFVSIVFEHLHVNFHCC